ncbi:universal stress protein [Pedobacter glucosidilyticus]|uniref:universal stress protein n=1 Tax=Pedobacter glucosidilyticus TaxID=1122941 RepID=UPI000403F42C|nr:universal stress protein [Pedobacter glucosidilyticus]
METLKILVPTDFSSTFNAADAVVSLLQKKVNTQVTLLHVIPVNGNILDEEAAENKVLTLIDEAKQKFKALQLNWKFDYLLKKGAITSTINEMAIELGVDVIIMGTKGSSGLMEHLVGSEAQHVARGAAVPIITVNQYSTPTKLQQILLLLDFEKPSTHPQLDFIHKIADQDACINLLHILKPNEIGMIADIEYNMREFAVINNLENYNVFLHSDDQVDEGVYNFNKDHEMDLVCIGTHGRKGFGHLLFGSVAERLINHCAKPVLTYHLNSL